MYSLKRTEHSFIHHKIGDRLRLLHEMVSVDRSMCHLAILIAHTSWFGLLLLFDTVPINYPENEVENTITVSIGSFRFLVISYLAVLSVLYG